MNNRYEIQDVLEAIDSLLNTNEDKVLKLDYEVKKPLYIKNKTEKTLRLIKEIKSSEVKPHNIPKDTEKIIAEAEKYLKK